MCQRNKVEHLHPAGLLQPLPVPSLVWADISMYFVKGFPKVHSKSVILLVVDRFSKYAHFIALGHPYLAASVVAAFFADIVRLHGMPMSIVSDRDPVFTGHFLQELFRLTKVQLQLSSVFHPQSDGDTEAVNKTIAMYFSCLASDRPRSWLQWLPWSEYCYNTSFQSFLRETPFKVVYGHDPPSLCSYKSSTAKVATVDNMVCARDSSLADIHDLVVQAKQVYKKYYGAKHRDLVFEEGGWVWLKLLHRLAASLGVHSKTKLSPRFYGPYQVLGRIGDVAYCLHLPARARIHDVFHVSQLKPFRGTPPVDIPSLPQLHDGQVIPTPAAVLCACLARGVREVLVHWQGEPVENAWLPLDEFRCSYPTFQLEDELLAKEGRDVMWGIQFQRRRRPGATGESSAAIA